MTIAPVANFEGLMRKTGILFGGRRNDAGDPIPFNNSLLNFSAPTDPPFLSGARTYTNVGPQLVGMGNALKIFITYNFASPPQDFEAWVNLCWIQRVKFPEREGDDSYVESLPSRSNKEVVRGWSDLHGNDNSAWSSCSVGIFYDTAATRVVSGDVDDLEIRDQRIKLPFNDPPFPLSVLDLPERVGSQVDWTRGIIYECVAKSDELYLVLTTSDEDYAGLLSDFISIDIAMGANAQGQQI